MDMPKLDESRLTPEQRNTLDGYNQAATQIKSLKDIADVVQGIYEQLDDTKKAGAADKIGALLTDMRESLASLNAKEAPESPDVAEPVVMAISKLERAVSDAIKAIDVKPSITLPAPQVTVPVDFTKIEKAMEALPKAFDKAIQNIDIPEPLATDFQPLLNAWQGISEQLLSIENATRARPLPGSIKVSNLSEVAAGVEANNPKYAAFQFDPNDSAPNYIGKNTDASADNNQGDWVVYKFTYSGSNVTAINKRVGAWSARTGLFP